MTVTASAIVETGYAAATETTVYTSAGKRTIIDKVSAYSAAGGTLALKLVPAGATVGAAHVLASKTLAAGETYGFPELVGQVLEAGDFISELAGTASTVVRRISGRVVT